MLSPKYSLNCRGKIIDLESPKVMGILNVTPDSFYDGGKLQHINDVLVQAEKMLKEGADFLDLGGVSSRPGAAQISEQEELRRVIPVIKQLSAAYPDAVISVDTFRKNVADKAIKSGAAIINDISAGQMEDGYLETVATLGCPYILMHMQGIPQTMQLQPEYENAPLEILDFLIKKLEKIRTLGLKDVIIDPGFGFGKTISHNYQILNILHAFQILDCPILVGISRKSMICQVLKVNPDRALNGTTTLHLEALRQGVKILRVHDVKEAVEVIKIYKTVKQNMPEELCVLRNQRN